MGSDDTQVTDPVLTVQEPDSASGAKAKPSHGSGVAQGSEPSSPSSGRHQEHVQNLKEQSDNFMDGAMGPNDNLINEMEAPVEEPDFPSVASMRSGGADPTQSANSCGGDGSVRAFCPWSLTEEEHVRNLKENFRRAFFGNGSELSRKVWADFKDDPWFARVVMELRADPGDCMDNSKVVSMEAPFPLLHVRPLHVAVLMGDLEMVQKILAETHSGPFNQGHIDSLIWGWGWEVGYSALDLAIVVGESEMVDALLEKNAKVNTAWRGSLQLAVLYAREERTSKIIQSLVHKGIDKNGKDHLGFTPFYLAVATGKTDIVKELLDKWKDKIKFNETCRGRPPIQAANEEGFKDIESALMQCEDVRRFIEEAFRDRQAYVDAANAILVGAALIASVTFASWLQPPLSYTTSYHGSSLQYVDVEHNIALGSFWVFNTLSFYFAIGTVVFGAHSVLPRRQLFITENVKKLSRNLLLTSILLAFSVLFVIVAFGIAGFIVLIPILRYRWYMIAPTILGAIVCVGSIGYLFKSVWENRPWSIRRKKQVSQMTYFLAMVYK